MTAKTATRAAVTATAAVVAVAGAGGVAYGYWTTAGAGTGSAAAGTSKTLGVDEPSVAGLYPTGAVSGVFTVTNSNDFKVVLKTASFGSVSVDSGHTACNVAAITFSTGTLPTGALSAKTGTAQVPFTASMSNAAVDACQGATFTATVTVTAESAV